MATFIARDEGYFEEEGLDVKILINPSGVVSIKQLLEGSIDIAHCSETLLMYALLDSTFNPGHKNAELRIISNMIMSNRIQKIIASTAKGILSPKDFVGKKVGLVKNSQSEYHLDGFFLENQIDHKKVGTVNLNPEEILSSLQNGEIDGRIPAE